MKQFIVSLFMILLFIPGSCTIAQEVRKVPATVSGLDQRWTWALDQAKDPLFNQGGWIGYSIDRLMEEDSWIGSYRAYPGKDDISLYELITGLHIEDPADDLRNAARKALTRSEKKRSGDMVLKEVALLFRFKDPSTVESSIREIQPTNMNLSVDLEGLPLLWLGKAPPGESLALLKRLYQKAPGSREKRKVIMAYGMHDSPAAFDLLKAIVEGDDQSDVRKDAVFWIGQQRSPGALEFLVRIVKSNDSHQVAERAVFAISLLRTDESTDVLIDLGKHAPNRELRKKAVFWLGQQASGKVLDTLKDFIYEDEDVEVQKQAVFALMQIHDEKGVTEIIRIAKTHPNPKIRKQAIFWLGQSDDPKAFDAIVEIAKGK